MTRDDLKDLLEMYGMGVGNPCTVEHAAWVLSLVDEYKPDTWDEGYSEGHADGTEEMRREYTE